MNGSNQVIDMQIADGEACELFSARAEDEIHAGGRENSTLYKQ